MSDQETTRARVAEPYGNHAVLQELPQARVDNQSVVRLASSRSFVRETANVSDLFDAMHPDESLLAVGVVDESQRVVGLVVRRDFFATMARPYARDVFKNHPVSDVMSAATTFSMDKDIFSISEEISEDMARPGLNYYVLVDTEGRYAGTFSSQDMLVYLSEITQKDIELARRLQSRIVMEREFVVGNRIEVVASSRTAKGVGGDFYEIKEYSPGKWLIAMCDVSGKGVAASIITSMLWGMMSLYDFNEGVVPFIEKLNNSMVQTFETEKFVTAVFLDYDEAEGTVEICDLGHSHLFLVREGTMRKITTKEKNLPLGIMPDLTPSTARFNPDPEDLVFVITDGLVEQQNSNGEVYPASRIAQILTENQTMPVEMISDRLQSDFKRFRGRRPLADDVTWSLMRFSEQDLKL